MSPTKVLNMDSNQPENRYGEFTTADAENKKDVADLLDKIQKKDVAWTAEDDSKLDSLRKRCPDYFDDNEDVSTEERLVTMEEDLEKEETDAKNRQIWRDTHPPIPETDWSRTTTTNDANNPPQSTSATNEANNPPQSTSATSGANNPSQSTSATSNPQDHSPSLPVNTAAEATTGSTEPSPKPESPIDFVVDKMESEMPNYTEPEDV